MVNPRDIAGERKKNKQKQNQNGLLESTPEIWQILCFWLQYVVCIERKKRDVNKTTCDTK